MKDWIWLALLGVGAYAVYEYMTGGSIFGVTMPSAAPQPAAGTTPTLQQIGVMTPAGGGEPTSAQLQNQLNRLTASPADWNTAYTTLTGRSIDTLYGFNFNAVYGGVGNSTITADAFIAMARATGLTPHITLSGFGKSYGPVYRTPVYRLLR